MTFDLGALLCAAGFVTLLYVWWKQSEAPNRLYLDVNLDKDHIDEDDTPQPP